MGWNGQKIKQLRRCLNWTPLQMSTRLGLTQENFMVLESSDDTQAVEANEIIDLLDHLAASVEKHITQIQNQPAIDVLLSNYDSEQIDSQQIDEFILEFHKREN